MIVSHLLLILHKKFYIFMFEAWNVAKGRKVQGGWILSQGTVTQGVVWFMLMIEGSSNMLHNCSSPVAVFT